MGRKVISFTETPHCVGALCLGAIALVLANVMPDNLAFIGWIIAALMLVSAIRTFGVTITVTPTWISRESPFGKWQLHWSELEHVEIGPGCMSLVLHGGQKRIWIARPTESLAAWLRGRFDEDGSDEEPLVDLVLGLAEDHEAGIGGGWLTPFKTSRA